MKLFRITFGHRDAPRLVLEVHAPDWWQAWEQHVCLRRPLERMDVCTL